MDLLYQKMFNPSKSVRNEDLRMHSKRKRIELENKLKGRHRAKSAIFGR